MYTLRRVLRAVCTVTVVSLLTEIILGGVVHKLPYVAGTTYSVLIKECTIIQATLYQ
jgi:hypothetical protein